MLTWMRIKSAGTRRQSRQGSSFTPPAPLPNEPLTGSVAPTTSASSLVLELLDHLRRIWRHRPGVVARRARAHHPRAPREPGRCCAGSSRGAGKRKRGGGIRAWRWRVTAPASGALRGRQYSPGRVERALGCEPSVQPRQAARPALSRRGTSAGRITTSRLAVPRIRAITRPRRSCAAGTQPAGRSRLCGGGLLPWCQVAVPGLEQAVKAVAEQAGREQRQQPRAVWCASHRAEDRV
jgi:hypothetical protein